MHHSGGVQGRGILAPEPGDRSREKGALTPLPHHIPMASTGVSIEVVRATA